MRKLFNVALAVMLVLTAASPAFAGGGGHDGGGGNGGGNHGGGHDGPESARFLYVGVMTDAPCSSDGVLHSGQYGSLDGHAAPQAN